MTPFAIVAGPPGSTDAAMATDLARVVAPDADVRLSVDTTSSGAAALAALGRASGGELKLGIVQADVFDAMQERANHGDVEAGRIMRSMRVVLPLGRREVYFVARADSPLQFIDQIRSARINVGPRGGGARSPSARSTRACSASRCPPRTSPT